MNLLLELTIIYDLFAVFSHVWGRDKETICGLLLDGASPLVGRVSL